MIKIFIGHFTWLPDNPCVFAGDQAQAGDSAVTALAVEGGGEEAAGGAEGWGGRCTAAPGGTRV